MTGIFKWIVNGLCTLPFLGLLACVFVVDGAITNGVGGGRTIAFYVMMGLVPPATALSFWINRQSLRYEPTDWLVPLFAFVGVGMTYVNHAVLNTKMVTLILLVVLYFSFRIFLAQQKANRHVLLLGLLITGGAQAILGLLQLYGYASSEHVLFRATGSFFNPGPYAGYLAVILPVAVFYALRQRRIIHRWVSLITIISIVMILPATMSRAAWLAAGIGTALVLIAGLNRHRKRLIADYLRLSTTRGFVRLSVVALVAVISLVGLYQLKKDSADGRTLIWKVSSAMFKTNWLGVGLGYFSGSYGEAQEYYFSSGQGTEQEGFLAGEPEYAFNELIQVGVELGIVPLVLLLAIIGYAMRAGIKNRRFGEAGSLLALVVFSCMSYPFSLLSFLVVFVLLIASSVSEHYRFTDIHDFSDEYLFNYQVRERWNRIWIIGLLAASIAVTAGCLYNRYPVYVAHKRWGESRVFYRAQAYEKVVMYYQPLLPFLSDRVHFLFEYGKALAETGRYEESNKVLGKASRISGDPMLLILQGKNDMKMEKYTFAIASFHWAANRVPHKLYPYYLMAKTYQMAGKSDEAREMAKYVLTKTVKVESPATREMKAAMKALIEGETSAITIDTNNE